MGMSLFREVLRLLPRHCVGPPIPYCPLWGLKSVMLGLQSIAVKLFFHFLVTYSALLIFYFCVADLKAIQYVRNQPVPYFGRQDLLSKRKGFYFFNLFLKKKKKKKKKS